MATVALTIAGRTYRMACGEGEEAHLQHLADHVDQTLIGLRKGFGEIGDMRLVVMAAITVADELFEAKRRIGELDALVAEGSAARTQADLDQDGLANDFAAALDEASERIERVARALTEAGT